MKSTLDASSSFRLVSQGALAFEDQREAHVVGDCFEVMQGNEGFASLLQFKFTVMRNRRETRENSNPRVESPPSQVAFATDWAALAAT